MAPVGPQFTSDQASIHVHHHCMVLDQPERQISGYWCGIHCHREVGVSMDRQELYYLTSRVLISRLCPPPSFQESKPLSSLLPTADTKAQEMLHARKSQWYNSALMAGRRFVSLWHTTSCIGEQDSSGNGFKVLPVSAFVS